MKKFLFLTSCLCFITSLTSAQFAQSWEFLDSAGTDLNDATNSGTIGTPWNFSLGSEPQGAVDGSGNLVIGFSAAAGSVAVLENFTRKADTPAWTVSSGTYTFEYRVSGWDLSATSSQNTIDGTNDREGFKLKLESSAGDQITTTFELNNGSIRTRHAATGGNSTASNGADEGFTTASTGEDMIIRIEGDLDAGTWGTSYNYNSTGFTSLVTDGAGVFDLSNIIFTVEGGTTSTWGANDYIAIDGISLAAVPEPTAFALAMGTACLGIILIRRRKSQ